MLSTAEIRWFIKGEVPEEVFAWFNGYDDFPISTQTRTDHYLRLPGNAIGIKIREGLIEHKQRDRVDGLWSDGKHSGQMEHWQKWSFPLEDDSSIPEMLSTYPESWLGVTKERHMRILVLDYENKVQCTLYEKVSGTAVGWEITKLKMDCCDDPWWTLGFEAFGIENELKDTLIKVCNTTLDDCPLALTMGNCYAYPELLNGI